MQQSTALILLAVVVLALIPIVPKMVALRVRVLRFVRLNRLADWHERHTGAITLAVRVMLGVLAAVLVYLGASAG